MKLWTLLRGLPWGLPHLAADVHELRTEVGYGNRLVDAARKALDARPPPPAFVCAMAEGEVEESTTVETPVPDKLKKRGMFLRATTVTEWKRTTVGGSKLLERSENLELVTWRPMRDVRVIVFADLSRVGVQLFHGAQPVTQAIGDCPIGYVPRWDVGVQIRVACHLRGSP